MNEALPINKDRDDASNLYTAAEVARLFDLPESRVRYWSQTGFIVPTVRRANRRFYTFRDLIAIKVAKELLDAGLPLQRVRRSLDALRLHLPRVDAPLARLRIRSDRERILVEEGETTFEATTGQLLLDFDVDKLRSQVAEVLTLPWVERRHGAEPGEPGESAASSGSALAAFARGLACENAWDGRSLDTPQYHAARRAYEQAVELDPDLAAAWTNLGSLLAMTGEPEQVERARDCFDAALRAEPEQPEALCNLAELALRSGELELAISGFRSVLRNDPDHLEAHYGLARALVQVGGRGQAIAHLQRFCAAVDRLAGSEAGAELLDRRKQVEQFISALRNNLA
jgi:DNA-binding transcriptional MerR regulator